MYKLIILFAMLAVASAGLIAPIVSGISTTQRIQSHIPIATTVGVPLVLGKGVGLGLGGLGGIGGLGVVGGLGGLGVVGGGLGGVTVAGPLGLGLGAGIIG